METYQLGKLTWPEINEAKSGISAVIIPVGSTEQHGPHLPFDTDTFTSDVLAKECAEECLSRKVKILVTPPVCFGVSWYHMDFAGTMSISSSVYIALIKDLLRSLIRHKFPNIVIFNSHGGNTPALTVAINDIYDEARARVYLVNWASLVLDKIKAMGIQSPMIHTEEIETSVAMAIGQRTLFEKAKKDCYSRREVYEKRGIPTSDHVTYDALNSGHGVVIPMDFIKDISSSGIVGDATLASEEKGKELVKLIIERVAEMISSISAK